MWEVDVIVVVVVVVADSWHGSKVDGKRTAAPFHSKKAISH